jgi:hypothetical protein
MDSRDGHVLLCLPYSVAILLARLGGFDPNLEEASMDLGQSGFGTFSARDLALMMPAVVASLLLSSVVSFRRVPDRLLPVRDRKRHCRSTSGAACVFRRGFPPRSRSAPASRLSRGSGGVCRMGASPRCAGLGAATGL